MRNSWNFIYIFTPFLLTRFFTEYWESIFPFSFCLHANFARKQSVSGWRWTAFAWTLHRCRRTISVGRWCFPSHVAVSSDERGSEQMWLRQVWHCRSLGTGSVGDANDVDRLPGLQSQKFAASAIVSIGCKCFKCFFICCYNCRHQLLFCPSKNSKTKEGFTISLRL